MIKYLIASQCNGSTKGALYLKSGGITEIQTGKGKHKGKQPKKEQEKSL